MPLMKIVEIGVYLATGWFCIASCNHAAFKFELPACIVKIHLWSRLTVPVAQVIKVLSSFNKDLCKSLMGLAS